jgi:hypothetical protein
MLLGSSIFVSAFVIEVRCRAFEIRFKEVLEEQQQKRDRKKTNSPNLLLLPPFSRRNSVALPTENQPKTGSKLPLRQRKTPISPPGGPDQPEVPEGDGLNSNGNIEAGQSGGRAGESEIKVTVDTIVQQQHPNTIEATSANMNKSSEEKPTKSINSTVVSPPLGGKILQPRHKHHRSLFFSTQGIGARFAHIPLPNIHQSAEEQDAEHSNIKSNTGEEFVPSSNPYARNSELAHLTHLERLRIGGVEYRAIRLLVWLVPAYFILWQLFGCISLGAWV